jgi:8-amino-7-oxononanoate synthase
MWHFEKQLLKRQQSGNLRSLHIAPPLIDFSSNDYLGLARSNHLAQAIAQECASQRGYFNGSTGSRLLTGNTAYACAVEERIAKFHGYEAGILFNCGYMANLGLLSIVAGPDDAIIYDSRVHASMREGIRISKAKALPFRHHDLDHLEHRLKSFSQGHCFVCIESVYSTDGSCSPLLEIYQLTSRYGAHLIVDEAHSTGVYGPKGRGLVAAYNLTPHIFAQVVTFGKALGTYGAIILGSNALKQALINFATSYIYTTALPFQILAAIKCSYDLIPEMESERQNLCHLIECFKARRPHSSLTPIQSIPVKGNERAKHAAYTLKRQGLDVRPLLSPTVQRGHESLRICLHAFNSESDLISLIHHIEHYV